MLVKDPYFFNRDVSWLGFNYRVLLEAADESVPLLERLNFLAIYSSNLDEFYRVRMPILLSFQKMGNAESGEQGTEMTAAIDRIVKQQMSELGAILTEGILPQLKMHQIHLVYNEAIPEFLHEEVTTYFFDKVAGFLQPVLLIESTHGLLIENNKLQILVVLETAAGAEQLAIVNIPTDLLPRFYKIYDTNTGNETILFLDDIIKTNLDKVFPGYLVKAAFSFKITRDASLDLHDEYEGDIARKIENQLKKRESGSATRFLYQPGIPLRILFTVLDKLDLAHAYTVAGGNYHNLKDLRAIPVVQKTALYYAPVSPIRKMKPATGTFIFEAIAEKDIIVHTPYQSYYPVTRFFTEAAVDQQVEEIFVTIYRVAADSMLVNSLITAAKNGKKVTVFVELKARFDEANNLKWSRRMKEAGVKIIYSIPGLKVHAKCALVKRREHNRLQYYGLCSTGNFNENTALVYTDHILLTAHPGIVRELELLFIFFSFRKLPVKYPGIHFEHLLVAQFNMQPKFLALIDKEIALAGQGKPATIILKINSLEDTVLINKLYEASNAGVKINLIVRAVCCLVPGVPGMSENITVMRIVDRFLEHGRIFVFHNEGSPLVYLGSADWMKRSMYHRIEVCFPVYDDAVRNELLKMLSIQLADNCKAVKLDDRLQNIFSKDQQPVTHSQKMIYALLGKRSQVLL